MSLRRASSALLAGCGSRLYAKRMAFGDDLRLGYAGAFVWGVAEATLFFIVPDVLLSAIGLKRGARAGLIASVCAALGAVVGGLAMVLWSAHDPDSAHDAVLAVPAVSAAMAERAAAAVAAEGWFGAALAGPLTFTPFKLYAILAPAAGVGLPGFALATIAARLPRFLIIALGAALLRRLPLPPTWLSWAVGVGWVLFYAAFFALTPN